MRGSLLSGPASYFSHSGFNLFGVLNITELLFSPSIR